MDIIPRPVALITGGSRGIGAATAIVLAERGYDVVITYRNKAVRAQEIVSTMEQYGGRALSLCCDITQQADLERLFGALRQWSGHLELLVLNAAGGLERDLVAADLYYPMRINRDAQLALVDSALPLMQQGGVVVFVTSHWAHLYGRAQHPEVYTPVAETKQAGEQALRARQAELAEHGIRLLVVTGDLIEGTIMSKLMERVAPGLTDNRRQKTGKLASTTQMGLAIADAATDTALPSGYTVVVGGTLDSIDY